MAKTLVAALVLALTACGGPTEVSYIRKPVCFAPCGPGSEQTTNALCLDYYSASCLCEVSCEGAAKLFTCTDK